MNKENGRDVHKLRKTEESRDNNFYFNKLKELVHQNRVSIKLIIGPTRSSSTLLEESLSTSPDINQKCHEPLLTYDANGAVINPSGYAQIYERIGGENFHRSGNSVVILIKDITYWLYQFGEYKRLFDLVKDPVLFLIRNPIITMESRIKKIAETLPSNLDETTKQSLLNLCGRREEHGMSNQDIFNLYAHLHGFPSWEELLTYSFRNHTYRYLGEILKISTSWFCLEAWGSEYLPGEISYLQNLNRHVILIDSSEFRLNPSQSIHSICSEWSITFDERMIRWGKGSLHLDPSANSVWFTRIASSSEVEPPYEIPPPMKEFPDFIQEQLLTKDIPAYARLLEHPDMIKARDTNDIEFELPLSDSTQMRVQELGVIEQTGNNRSLVSIRDVDPVFAICREPQLLSDASYLRRKKEYQDVIQVVRNIL